MTYPFTAGANSETSLVPVSKRELNSWVPKGGRALGPEQRWTVGCRVPDGWSRMGVTKSQTYESWQKRTKLKRVGPVVGGSSGSMTVESERELGSGTPGSEGGRLRSELML